VHCFTFHGLIFPPCAPRSKDWSGVDDSAMSGLPRVDLVQDPVAMDLRALWAAAPIQVGQEFADGEIRANDWPDA
jgi:hypothetical protein